jgi:hypothetical protein
MAEGSFGCCAPFLVATDDGLRQVSNMGVWLPLGGESACHSVIPADGWGEWEMGVAVCECHGGWWWWWWVSVCV